MLDFFGRPLGLIGKLANFDGDNGESFSLFPCACSFHCGVQCQHIRTAGHIRDEIGNGSDLRGMFAEFQNLFPR